MELRIDTSEGVKRFEIDHSFMEQVIGRFVEEALSKIDEIPLAMRSIKTTLKVGMGFYGVTNPDPKHQTDIDYLMDMGIEKMMEFLSIHGIDIEGEIIEAGNE